MASLKNILVNQADQDEVIADALTLLESEVSSKKGPTGFAIKNGYKVFKGIRNGAIARKAIRLLLPEMTIAVDPFYQQYLALAGDPKPSFQQYLTTYDTDVAEALLGVTDYYKDYTQYRQLVGIYNRLRPLALTHVRQAVPGLGQLIEKYI